MRKKRPFITAAHAKARFDWAIRHQAYTINDWMRVSEFHGRMNVQSREGSVYNRNGPSFGLQIKFERGIYKRFGRRERG